jgi:hypothetical protein
MVDGQRQLHRSSTGFCRGALVHHAILSASGTFLLVDASAVIRLALAAGHRLRQRGHLAVAVTAAG